MNRSKCLLALGMGLAMVASVASGADAASASAPVPVAAASAASAVPVDAVGWMRKGDKDVAVGHYQDALGDFQAALRLRSAADPASLDVAVTLFRIGTCHRWLEQNPQALAAYQRALAIDETRLGKDSPSAAVDLMRIAEAQERLLDFSAASASLQRALDIRMAKLDASHPAIAETLLKQAALYGTLAHYGQAMEAAQRALSIRQARFGASSSQAADGLSVVASLYDTLGRYDLSEETYRKSLAIDEMIYGSRAAVTASHLADLAYVVAKEGRTDEAIALYGRSLAIRREAEPANRAAVSVLLNNEGFVLLEAHRLAEALPLLEESMKIKVELSEPDVPDAALTLRHIGDLHVAAGRPAQGRPYIERAYAIAQVYGRDQPLLLSQAQFSMAQLLKAENQTGLAILYGKMSINTIQNMRLTVQSLDEASQKSFLQKNSSTYQMVADWLIDAGRLPEAQSVLGILKEQEYKDFLQRGATTNTSDPVPTNTQESPWATRFQQISERVFALAAEKRALQRKRDATNAGLSAADEDSLQAVTREVAVANKAFDSAMREVRTAFATLDRNADGKQDQVLDANQRSLVHDLGEGVLLLDTISLQDHVQLILSDSTVRKSYRVNVSRRDLNHKIEELLVALKRPDIDPRPAAKALYDTLISPLAADLEQSRPRVLMVSLDGALRYVPIAALYDGQQYVAQKYAISVYNYAAHTDVKVHPQENWSVAAFGVSKGHQIGNVVFAPLPSVPIELAGIVGDAAHPGGVLRGTKMLDEAFSDSALQNLLQQEEHAPVVHIASHYHFGAASADSSYLLLGDGSKLTLQAFKDSGYGMTGVDLLTLSACETAVGSGPSGGDATPGSRQGDDKALASGTAGTEVEGLAVQAQLNGAKAVIATLWSVNDTSTGAFMQRFYALHATKLNKAEAMRRVQMEMIDGRLDSAPSVEASRGPKVERAAGYAARYTPYQADPSKPFAHPYYWAPFVLMGNWL